MKLYQINEIRLDLNDSEHLLKQKVANVLNIKESDIDQFIILKQAIDARKKSDVHYKYNLAFSLNEETNFLHPKVVPYQIQKTLEIPKKSLTLSPIVVGSGPSGLFAALILARANLKPIVLEMGKNALERQRDVENFWAGKPLLPNSNVQFGHGGAGTFSDGKLNSGVKSEFTSFILSEFVKHGAPKEIEYAHAPHVGTDILIDVLHSMQHEIESLGGKFLFEHKLVSYTTTDNQLVSVTAKHHDSAIELMTNHMFLCIGHSSRETFAMLHKNNLPLEQKPFSMGVRIEHLQETINQSQYGDFAKLLPAADYKLSCHLKNGRSVYTFCMCPGGYVVNASSEKDGVVCNGMSYHARDGQNANAALLVNVNLSDFESSHPLAGIEFQKKWEQKAFELSHSHKLPVQKLSDFLENKVTTHWGSITPQTKGETVRANLNECLPDFVIDSIKKALPMMEQKIKHFASPDAVLTGVETRSSCPVRIERDASHQTPVKGIFACGEGAGFAGGIMSASVDGIKTALHLLNLLP